MLVIKLEIRSRLMKVWYYLNVKYIYKRKQKHLKLFSILILKSLLIVLFSVLILKSLSIVLFSVLNLKSLLIV